MPPEPLENTEPPRFQAPKPDRLADLDIPSRLVQDIFLRSVWEEGESCLSGLRDRLKVSTPIVDTVFQQLRQQQCVEVKGLQGKDYAFSLTRAGRALAAERAAISGYAGPVPVSLAAYDRTVRAQAARIAVDRDRLGGILRDLVLPDHLLDLLGPALISQKSVFLYGPTGNGKTSLAERLIRVYDDAVLIPYAVELRGHIITVFDPVWHVPLETQPVDLDPRWVLCRRPCVTVGGELVSEMLELRLDTNSGIYAAPLQVMANNGILVIDDFGRQVMSPRELLNRWIVPLDRRVDYLTLDHGQKLRVPFELVVVFATNLDPADLADEAFLRRIHNKIYIGAISEETFLQILARVMEERQIHCTPEMAGYMVELCSRGGRQLRACYPADICDLLLWRSRYENQPLQISPQELEAAAEVYFTRTNGSSAAKN